MKKTRNLVVKNNCFMELPCKSLTKDMNRRALSLLMFMMLKRNGDLNSRGAANGSFQLVFTDKVDCASSTPSFYALKHVAAVVAKESLDTATVNLQVFFLQTKANKEDKPAIIKLTGAVVLLLVEFD